MPKVGDLQELMGPFSSMGFECLEMFEVKDLSPKDPKEIITSRKLLTSVVTEMVPELPTRDLRAYELLDRLRALKEDGYPIPDGCTHVRLQGNPAPLDFERRLPNGCFCFYWSATSDEWESFVPGPQKRAPLSLLTDAELAEFMPKKSNPSKEALLMRLRALKEEGCLIPDGSTHVVVDASTKPSPMNYKRDTGSERLRVWKPTSQCWGPGVWKPADPGMLPLSLLTADELAEFKGFGSPKCPLKERLLKRLRVIKSMYACDIPPGSTHVDTDVNIELSLDNFYKVEFGSTAVQWCQDDGWWYYDILCDISDKKTILPLSLLTDAELLEFTSNSNTAIKPSVKQLTASDKEMITADGEPEDAPAEESQPAVAAFPATAYGIDSTFPRHLGGFHGG